MLSVPVVRSIYGAVKDMIGLLGDEKGPALQVVSLTLPGSDWRVIGFVTRSDFADLPAGVGGPAEVAVYLPMSFGIGGYTVIVPRGAITPIDMSRRSRDEVSPHRRAQEARAATRVSLPQQLQHRRVLDFPRIGIRRLGRDARRALEVGFLHAQVGKPHRQSERAFQIEYARGSVTAANRALHARHGLARAVVVVAHGVRQHDGMRLGMRQVEAAAEHVAQLVVQRHAGRAERDAAKPRAVKRLASWLRDVLRVLHHRGQGFSERANALLRHQRDTGLPSCA